MRVIACLELNKAIRADCFFTRYEFWRIVLPHFVGAHMRFWQASSVLALVLGFAASSATAQGDIPAEFPPASFTGKQYVDSRGCVYVRAGISGNTTWIPRVTRQRKQICGMQPSLGSSTRTAQAPVQRPAAPEIIVPRQAAQATAPRRPAPPRIFQRQPGPPIETVASARAAQNAPAPRQVVRVPAAQPRVVVRRPVTAAPVVTQTAPRRVVAAPQPTRRSVTCQGASAVSSRYINSGEKAAVRCGPQAEAPVTIVRGATGQRAGSRVITTVPAQRQVIAPPPGYRRVWEDDRLNPNRGPRSAQGDAQMARVWTNTVPRKSVNTTTRTRNVGGCQGASALSNRYINSGQKAAVRCGPQAEAPVTYVTRQVVTTQRAKVQKQPKRVVRKQHLSAMNAPAPRQQARAASHRFVQVGTFGVPQNATQTARRLQSTGLPVRLSRYSKGGKTYTIVLAGPFGTQSQLNAGLNMARKAGFSDAFLRK